MKRFLSVLLALAVAFTFTFGSCMSAFAANYATTDKYIEAVNTLEAEKLDYEAAQYAVAVAQAKTAKTVNVEYTSGKNIAVDTAAYLTALEGVYTAVKNDITAQTKALKSATGTPESDGTITYTDPAYTTYDASDMLDLAAEDTTGWGAANVDLNCATTLIAAQLDANKAAYVKNIGTVDTTIYSETKVEEASAYSVTVNGVTTKYYTAKDYADAIKAKAVTETNAVVYVAAGADKDTLATLGKKVADLKVAVDAVIEDTDADGIYTLVDTSILTKVKEESENAKTEAAKASKKSQLAADIATYKATPEFLTATDKTPVTKEQVTEYLAAYEEVHTYLIENTNTYTANPAMKVAGNTEVAKAKAVADAKKAAAEIIAEVTAEGKPAYVAETVNKNLDTVVGKLYAGTAVADVAAALKADAKNDYISDFKKATMKADLDATDLTATYYAKEIPAVQAVIDTYKAAIDAATTQKNLDDAKTAYDTEIAKICKKADVDALYGGAATTLVPTADAKLTAAVAAAKNVVKASIDSLNVNKDPKDKVPYDEADVTKYMKENGARTADEVTALTDACKAELAKAETTNQKTAAADAVTAKINALPATLTITAADKAAVLDAAKAYAELSVAAQALVDATALKADVAAIAKIDAAAITDAILAITGTKTVVATDGDKATIANKAAVKAAEAAAKEYAETYKGYTVTDISTENSYVTKAVAAIKTAEKKAVVDAINALPTEITADNKAAVEAARAAYDAYVAEYTSYVAPTCNAAQELADANANLAKLMAAEATIAELCKYTDKDAKAYMFDMKVTATAKKVKKTTAKMTVKADVTELTDNGYTVTYKYAVKAPGSKKYVTKKTSTKKSYTFTKLKKGKNTFKVTITVKNAEGTVVGTKTKTKTYTRK